MSEYSDKELLDMFHSGDNPNYAFNLIVRKYQERLYYYIRRMVVDHDDADDVLQNTFVKAWKGLGKFRAEANLYTWLYRIATNEALTFIQKRNKQNKVSLDDAANYLSQNLESDHYYSGDEIQQKLQTAIETLPEKQKEVFILKYFEEKKYDEISEILGTSVGALKASYHHAVKKIEKYLTGG